MDDAPVLLLACIEHGGSTNLTTGSSIYPAVQNILLAARGLGLGSVLTTFHKQYEDEVRTIFGIPHNVETAALLPIGYPADGAGYGPTRRKPLDEVTHWDGWTQDQLTSIPIARGCELSRANKPDIIAPLFWRRS